VLITSSVEGLISTDFSQGLMAAAGVQAGRFLDLDFRPGYDPWPGRLGRLPGFHGPWFPFLAQRDRFVLVRLGVEWLGALPYGSDRFCPGPGDGDLQDSVAAARTRWTATCKTR
jgi:hypothetical protein